MSHDQLWLNLVERVDIATSSKWLDPASALIEIHLRLKAGDRSNAARG